MTKEQLIQEIKTYLALIKMKYPKLYLEIQLAILDDLPK